MIIELLSTIPPIPISFLLAWIPFIKKSYEVSGPFWWIQSTYYDENCTKTVDSTNVIIYYSLYEIVGFISIILCIILFAMYCKIRKSYQFENAKNLLRKILTLMSFQVHVIIIRSYRVFSVNHTHSYTSTQELLDVDGICTNKSPKTSNFPTSLSLYLLFIRESLWLCSFLKSAGATKNYTHLQVTSAN